VEIGDGAIIKCNYELCVEWSINPVSNPKPHRQSLKIATILLGRYINKNEMVGICNTLGPWSEFRPTRLHRYTLLAAIFLILQVN
jgi:hypothetical protein